MGHKMEKSEVRLGTMLTWTRSRFDALGHGGGGGGGGG